MTTADMENNFPVLKELDYKDFNTDPQAKKIKITKWIGRHGVYNLRLFYVDFTAIISNHG